MGWVWNGFSFPSTTGLGLVLKRETSAVSRDRRLCGVLICEEIVSPTSDKARAVPSVLFDNIESMSVFKRVSTTSDVSASDKHEDLIGSVTSEAPSLSQLANGRKIDGLLEAGRATIRVELVKQDDCQAEFVCQVRGLDTQGRQALSSSSLVPHPSQREDQVYDRREMPAMSPTTLHLAAAADFPVGGRSGEPSWLLWAAAWW